MISHGIVILYVYWIHNLNMQTLINFSWFIHVEAVPYGILSVFFLCRGILCVQ